MKESPTTRLSRRWLLWMAGGLTAMASSGVGIVFVFLRSGAQDSSSDPVIILATEELPAAGEPPRRFRAARAWVVRLAPGEGTWRGLGQPATSGGYLVLSQKCPYRGCTVPWLADFEFQGATGWFRCTCCGSTYTRAGVRVRKPAPRSLDAYACEFRNGSRPSTRTG